jgi:hypothetical protein
MHTNTNIDTNTQLPTTNVQFASDSATIIASASEREHESNTIIHSNIQPSKFNLSISIPPEYNELLTCANSNICTILQDSLNIKPTETLLIIYDTDTILSSILTQAYKNQQQQFPNITTLHYNQHSPEQILEYIYKLIPHDTVILIQSDKFQLNEYRIRLKLFELNLKTIEHVHLKNISPQQYHAYINSLGFSPSQHKRLANQLKEQLDQCKNVTVTCKDGSVLNYLGGMEPAKINIGDYTDMKNIGGTYPIGKNYKKIVIILFMCLIVCFDVFHFFFVGR